MKSALIVAASLLPSHLFALSWLNHKKNELGLFAETNSMDSYNGSPVMSTVGLTYKHHKNDFLSLVLSAGQTNYNMAYSRYNHPIDFNDTLRWRDIRTNASLATISVAAEVQRKFYKRVSFFAGGEFRASYGTGRTDTANITEYKVPYPGTNPGNPRYIIDATVTNTTGAGISVMQAGLLPYIGVKVSLNRLTLGYSLSNYMFRFQSEASDNHTYSLLNFELGNTYQRLFVTYKF